MLANTSAEKAGCVSQKRRKQAGKHGYRLTQLRKKPDVLAKREENRQENVKTG